MAQFEYRDIKENGLIYVLNPLGEIIGKFDVPEYPEIIGIQFWRSSLDILLITENSDTPVCLRVRVPNDILQKTHKDKNKELEGYE